MSAPSAINIKNPPSTVDSSKIKIVEDSSPKLYGNQIPYQPPKSDSKKYQVFSSGRASSSSVDLGKIFSKMLVYSILLLPGFLIGISIAVYIQQVNGDLTQIGEYPAWVSKSIEEFVRNSIMPIIQTE